MTSVQDGSASLTSGSDTTIGSAITAPGIYVVRHNVSSLAVGETLQVTLKTKMRSGSSYAVEKDYTVAAPITEVNGESDPITVTDALEVHFTLTAGATRAVPWNIVKLS